MLSDAEQQRLTEIEAQLRNDDPVFVQRFGDGRGRRPRWHRLTATLALAVAAAVVCVGLVVGSVGTVVVALTALGAIAGMWVTGRNRP